MKIILTRLGYHSKAVVTGDVTQIDLPKDQPSGLLNAREVLGAVKGIGFMAFTEADVVRHPLVQSIVRAYDRDSQRGLGALSTSPKVTQGIDSEGVGPT